MKEAEPEQSPLLKIMMQGEIAAGEGKYPDLPTPSNNPKMKMLEALSVFGGTFDYLADEPDEYLPDEGEPV